MDRGVLDVSSILDGARIVLFGGTGFLGKIFWSMLLDRYDNVGRIFLVVRAKGGLTPEDRFWKELAEAVALGPLRRAHGDHFEAFVRDKVIAIDGDIGRPLCGIDVQLVRELKGTIDAVVNVAGVVDFNPPLDDALDANAFGAQNVVALAKALGDAPVVHTSTCYVAGTRRGLIREEHPCSVPFPRAGELAAALWDPEREIAECLDLAVQARHRCEDAFRQSSFAERARMNLLSRGEPVHGEPYDRELARIKRRYISDRLVEAGLDRATHWGWPNIYTYTKAIGEQVVARSGLPFTILRPACCESTVAFPDAAYNEGVNTSAPLIYLIMKGQPHILGKHVPLDFVPADYVVAGMILALAELLEGTAKPVYQFGAADVNPCTVQRFGELVGLYKRKYYRQRGAGNPLWNALQARYEPAFVDRAGFDALGPQAIARAAGGLASFVRRTGRALEPAAKALDRVAAQQGKIAEIQELFAPFTTAQLGPFDCSNTRAARDRLSDRDKAKLPWAPESIDWADWMMNVHMPAMESLIIPAMDRRLKEKSAPRPLAPHATLVSLVDEMAERHDLALALQRMSDEGLTRTSFRDVKLRMDRVGARLVGLGVQRGDRVALAAQNHPDWAIAFFGILRAGATAVPIDPALDAPAWATVLADSGARVVIWDDTVKAREQVAADNLQLVQVDLHAAHGEHLRYDQELGGAAALPEMAIEPSDVATLMYTSGTDGRPKGVMLAHGHFTSLIAALAPIFPLAQGDAVLSVLPLHHTFELTCGLLLPLSRGARVVYVGEVSGDRIAKGLRASRATAMVGVPALWQLLERRILQQVDEHGPLARAAFDAAAGANGWLVKNLGVDAGRVLFGSVHASLGGRMKWLISGGAALPSETRRRMASLGLAVTQGPGRTEASPVLAAENAEPRLGSMADVATSTPRTPTPPQARSETPLVLPEPVQELGRALVGKLQDVIYGELMKPRVYGRAHIPYNRNVIVAANHASHLDMGLVRHALGKYGEDLVALAAHDDLFESGIKRAFFENLTNLRPVDRKASLREAIRQASDVVEQGKTILLFPEGTRTATGEIQEFKPLVGHLALAHGVDILPVFIGGTHAAMPKGSKVPIKREIMARIGPPLRADDLRRRTEGMSAADAAREVARMTRASVVALGEGKVLDLSTAARPDALAPASEHPLVTLFGELEAKFRAGEVKRPVSYYVTLGNDELAKWTVRVDASACDVRPGKPEGGQADCVLKTSPEIFARIVRESYVPSPADFLSGAIKSNDVALLITFQKVFQLEARAQ
jgi:long-chain acyl-CoA synthetase